MNNHEQGTLILEYLCERNYISVSQIIQGYFRLTNDFWNPENIERFQVKIRKPIVNHCRIINPQIDPQDSWDKALVAVEFSVRESGRQFKHYLVSDGEKIVGRSKDYQPNWTEVLLFDGESVRISKHLNLHIADALMGAGKALIQRSTPCMNPRVVEFFITQFISSVDDIDCVLTLDPFVKKDFRKLKLYKNQRLIGHLWFWTGLG